MYYDIVIDRPERPREHFWVGYGNLYYAHAALASVARIVRESAPFGSPVVYRNDQHPISSDNAIHLMRDRAPYATISVAESPVKRADVGSWIDVGTDEYHVVAGYVGSVNTQTACGADFPAERCTFVMPATKNGRCLTCVIMRRGEVS